MSDERMQVRLTERPAEWVLIYSLAQYPCFIVTTFPCGTCLSCRARALKNVREASNV